jgi:hypothetical protein
LKLKAVHHIIYSHAKIKRSQLRVNPGSTWGQPGVNLGSNRGQPGVNPGSTQGQPTPPYLIDAKLCEHRGLIGVLHREVIGLIDENIDILEARTQVDFESKT